MPLVAAEGRTNAFVDESGADELSLGLTLPFACGLEVLPCDTPLVLL